MKGNVAIIVPPGTSTLMPSYLNTLERGWIHPGVVVLLLEKGSKNGYRKVMCQGSIVLNEKSVNQTVAKSFDVVGLCCAKSSEAYRKSG